MQVQSLESRLHEDASNFMRSLRSKDEVEFRVCALVGGSCLHVYFVRVYMDMYVNLSAWETGM